MSFAAYSRLRLAKPKGSCDSRDSKRQEAPLPGYYWYISPLIPASGTETAPIEPTFGSDVKRISTRAVKSEDGKHYTVTGQKKWITNGIWSDYFTTAVRTSGNPGDSTGISILLIPRVEGVVTRKMKMGGQWAAGTTYIDFEEVKVPVANLIGKEGEGMRIIMTNFNHERLGICIGANAIARSVLGDAMTYAHKREVFQGKLIDQGVIRNKLGNMARLVESQQAWLEQIVYQMEHLSKAEGDRLLGGTTALAKAHCGLVCCLRIL